MPAPAPAPERILQRLDWQVIRRLDGLLQGDYRSLFYGNGLDFSDLREYQPGDDVRYIDWNVTARMDAPYVRQYVEDREISAWFLLDLSPSVDFGTIDGERAKRSVLIDFVTTLARLLTRHGNRVGAMFYGSSVYRTIPARGGRIQVLRLIDDLLKQPTLPAAPFTDLTPLLLAGQQGDSAPLARIPRLGFHQRTRLGAAAGHAPTAATSASPCACTTRARHRLPDLGPVILEDAETGEQLYLDTHDASFRRRFERAAAERETALASAFRTAGVDAVSVSTDDDLVRTIVRMAELRRRRRN